MFKYLSVLPFMAFIFIGCGESAKTTDYYKQNVDECKARVAECKSATSLTAEEERDCNNANFAYNFLRNTGGLSKGTFQWNLSEDKK